MQFLYNIILNNIKIVNNNLTIFFIIRIHVKYNVYKYNLLLCEEILNLYICFPIFEYCKKILSNQKLVLYFLNY